jgi:predicted dehydrogenase
MPDRIFIIGLGSIGQRHARNALALGCEVIGYDPRPPLFPWVPPDSFRWTRSLEEGLALHPLGVIVATPPETHRNISQQVTEAGFSYLVEKPVAHLASDAGVMIDDFRRLRLPLAVGYQLRHTAALRALKAKVDAGTLGRIYTARAWFASRAWCSHTYESDLVAECSHELDLLRWFLGDPETVTTIWWDPPRTVIAQFTFSGATAEVRLEGEREGYRRGLLLTGTSGSVGWTFDKTENNAAYIAELADFLAVCRGEKQPECSGRDGWWACRIVEAIRRSGESGRWETC